VIEATLRALSVMSEVRKNKSNPFPLRLEAQQKALRFNPARFWGALETPSRVKMNAKERRP
jgi:hypothetical protein